MTKPATISCGVPINRISIESLLASDRTAKACKRRPACTKQPTSRTVAAEVGDSTLKKPFKRSISISTAPRFAPGREKLYLSSQLIDVKLLRPIAESANKDRPRLPGGVIEAAPYKVRAHLS